MQALQWSTLPRIEHVSGDLDEDDVTCLTAVAAVLKKYGKEWRFGVNFLHSHFDLRDDEVLVETSDPRDQSLWVRPMPRADVDIDNITVTAWCLADGTPQMACHCKKLGDDHSHHELN